MFAYSFGKSNATATRDVLSEIEQIARKQWLVKKNLCLVVYIASNVSNGAFFLRLYDYISFNLFQTKFVPVDRFRLLVRIENLPDK